MIASVGNIIFKGYTIPLYSDPYMEENKIIRGRKGGSTQTFWIAHPSTASILYKLSLTKQRRDKLKKLSDSAS